MPKAFTAMCGGIAAGGAAWGARAGTSGWVSPTCTGLASLFDFGEPLSFAISVWATATGEAVAGSDAGPGTVAGVPAVGRDGLSVGRASAARDLSAAGAAVSATCVAAMVLLAVLAAAGPDIFMAGGAAMATCATALGSFAGGAGWVFGTVSGCSAAALTALSAAGLLSSARFWVVAAMATGGGVTLNMSLSSPAV